MPERWIGGCYFVSAVFLFKGLLNIYWNVETGRGEGGLQQQFVNVFLILKCFPISL